MTSDAALINIEKLGRVFGGSRRLLGGREPRVHALHDVSLDLKRGETLGIVGESGCGKSTLARLLAGLDRPTAGTITLSGGELGRNPKARARRIQYVFQDPVSSLNPRKTIRAILEAPLIHLLGMDRAQRTTRLAELMNAVNLRPEFLDRYPHEFSGGQAQRIGIARALAADPEIIVLDEPVSALDVSVQAQVLNILDDLKRRFDLTYVFISHDLSVIESVSDRVVVMYFGRLAEIGNARQVFGDPRHPYTQLLLRSAPVPGRSPEVPADANTELPDPYDPPKACAFAARCPRADDHCRAVMPAIDEDEPETGHMAACYHPGQYAGGA